jgi:hypothetical protein
MDMLTLSHQIRFYCDNGSLIVYFNILYKCLVWGGLIHSIFIFFYECLAYIFVHSFLRLPDKR